ncbi:spectrin beta chain, non-erythrocytic 5-like [Spea bombifrons]|uniref:spectrin beta chain, non-erythrocytic 5-like n=1 Tax=Spea bombifrons TaxID=233779 RepID=UPI00234AABA4|nr:spectrin beta chain, non-erythrocytic 5-like [Spea bombifrons]
MSQSVIRKAQPFTIGTRLSLPKCPEFAPGGPGAADSCPPPLNERVSQYLAHARPPPRGFSPHRRTLRPDSPTEGITEDHGLGQACLARAIKKITLSVPGDRGGKADPGVLALKSQGNFNNNNSRPLRDAVARNWVPCISAPPRSWAPGIGGPPGNRVPGDAVQVISAPPGNRGVGDVNSESGAEPPTPTNRATDLGSSPEAWRRDRVGTPGSDADGRRRPSAENPQIAQLSRDITQAESWIRGKLRSLKDRCDAGPPQDWEPGPHPIHSEIKGFEPTVMKLNQIGEHLSRSQTPSTAALRAQLQSLTGQWQLLKQTAANQSNAMGGAKVLQEFNKKADELEIWMREKEEKPSLPLLLDENLDKMRLTRQILDLKQEQLRYRNLQEDINSLAQKLEKQGRVESRGPSTRRKQLNKMWLRLQDSLEEHQKGLQLALEAATLWQQMDTILKAMDEKRHSVAVRNEGDSEGRGDQEMRDIASQILLLDITVSQISGLHSSLASRAAQKQRQVKESWAQLQHALRRDKSMRPTSAFTREPSDPVTPSAVGNQATETPGDGKKRAAASSPKPRTGDEVIALHHNDQTRRQTSLADRGRQIGGSEYNVPNRPLSESSGVNQLMKDLSSTEQWLQDLEVLLSEPAAMRSPEVIRRNLREVSILEREVKSRGQVLHGMDSKARQPGAPEWRLSEETRGKMQEVKERIQMVLDALRRRASDLRDTLVLSEFMKIVQMEEERRSREMSRSGGAVREGPCDLGTESQRREVFTPLEELQEAVEMLNDAAKERERTVAITKETENLEIKLSELSQRICAAQTWLDDIRRQTEVAERDFALVKSQTDLKDLQELFILQQELEAHVLGSLRLDVRRLEDQQHRLRDLCPQRSHEVARSIREALQAWAQLQEKVQETKAQLEKTDELRRFFLSYLEMISWTEDTRAQIFSESPCQRPAGSRGEELERRIEGKLKEFESLASIGWKFIGEEHFLTQTIKERMEELQGMLSWVLMRWRCQKQQRIMGNKMEKKRPKEVLEPRHELKDLPSGEVHQASGIPAESADGESPRPRGPTLRRYSRKAHSPMSLHSAGNEVDIQQGPEPQEQKTLEGPVWLQPKQMPLRAERGAEDEAFCAPPLPRHPATFWRRCQGLLGSTFSSLTRKKRVSFPAADEVSACLHVKPPGQSACHSLTAPRPSKQSRVLDQYSPQCAPVTGDPTISSTKIRSHLLFSGPNRKQKARWRTVQGIMGASSGEVTRRPEEASPYQTLTWPPKQKKVPAAGEGPAFPPAKDIDSQCETFGSDAVRKRLHFGVSSSRRRLTLGSVLSLQIQEEGGFLGNVQETATESAKESGDETVPVSVSDNSMNNREPRESGLMSSTGSDPSAGRSWIEALSRSAGYCRLNLHGYGSSAGGPTARWLPASHEDLFNFEIDRLSPIGVLHKDEEPEWDRLDVTSRSSQDQDGSQVAEDTAREDSCPPPVLGRPWRKASPPALPEVLHPDQDFLEHDDEELEGIWNNARRGHVGFPTFTSEPKLIKAAERPRPAKTPEVDISKAPGGQVLARISSSSQGLSEGPRRLGIHRT